MAVCGPASLDSGCLLRSYRITLPGAMPCLKPYTYAEMKYIARTLIIVLVALLAPCLSYSQSCKQCVIDYALKEANGLLPDSSAERLQAYMDFAMSFDSSLACMRYFSKSKGIMSKDTIIECGKQIRANRVLLEKMYRYRMLTPNEYFRARAGFDMFDNLFAALVTASTIKPERARLEAISYYTDGLNLAVGVNGMSGALESADRGEFYDMALGIIKTGELKCKCPLFEAEKKAAVTQVLRAFLR